MVVALLTASPCKRELLYRCSSLKDESILSLQETRHLRRHDRIYLVFRSLSMKASNQGVVEMGACSLSSVRTAGDLSIRALRLVAYFEASPPYKSMKTMEYEQRRCPAKGVCLCVV